MPVQLRYFIEEQRAKLARSSTASSCFEQFLETRSAVGAGAVRDAWTVQFEKRTRGPERLEMDELSDDVLARAALAFDKHRNRRGRQLIHLAPQDLHRFGTSEDDGLRRYSAQVSGIADHAVLLQRNQGSL